MGKLVLFRPGGAAQDIALDRERITIGRRPDNDVCLAHPAVSGEHAAVVTILSDSFLEDLGSTNGTLVNGDPISKHFLCNGDEIEIGRQVLVYVVDESARLVTPPSRPARHEDRPGREGGVPDESSADSTTPIAGLGPSAVAAVAPDPEVRFLSGHNAGRRVALAKHETLIGRAGVQVAALRRDAGEMRLIPVEGSVPPSLNGTPVAPDGARLAGGDILEIAGARLEFVVPPDGGS